YLTRSIDRDFLYEADSTLAGDLQARVDMADSLQPDIFVSIHHNAQPQREPDRNLIETYYKAGDPASLDLAFSVHRHLMRNLGIDAGEVRQGNYYVLRENDVPSILGESSYLTHPPVEAKLQLSDTQRLEAEAYFLGILDYFSRGLPRIRAVTDSDSVRRSVPELTFAVADDGGFGIDPDGVDLRINGRAVHAIFDRADDDAGDYRSLVRYRMPHNSANGAYEVTLSVRNLGGNTSALHVHRFAIDHPAVMAVFDPSPAVLPPGGAGEVHMRVRLLDRRGVPVADGKPVRAQSGPGADRVHGMTRDGGFEFPIRYEADGSLTISVSCDGETFSTRLVRGGGDTTPRWKSIRVLDRVTGSPVTSVRLEGGAGQIDVSSPGRYYVARDGPVTIGAPGYMPRSFDSLPGDTIRLNPWFGGTLIGLRFVLDPEAGRLADVGMGPLGLSAAWVNLRVAHYLTGFLRTAGADVLLTRTNEEVPTPQDIARMTNRYGADRYIEIRHRALPGDSALATRTYHFPGSSNGSRMAADVGAVLARRLPHPARPAASLVTYPLQQTACPAIVIDYPSIADRTEELRLDTSRYLREQAYATFVGILEHYAVPDTCVISVTVDAPNAGRWLIWIDDTWTLLPDSSGLAVFERFAPGPHTVRATHAGRSVVTNCHARGDSTSVTLSP
ncbi:MAG: N-acetylmuramoyl-L-alanine amidase, partial [Candidatus Krumholzibacteriota bacterium]|nr:N-acetylmuramoyl-L-alanine amidase [Candidatus Krumholzibacteriota bacterium]